MAVAALTSTLSKSFICIDLFSFFCYRLVTFFNKVFFTKNTHTDVVEKIEKRAKWDSVVLVVSESKCGVEEEDNGHGVTGRYFAK